MATRLGTQYQNPNHQEPTPSEEGSKVLLEMFEKLASCLEERLTLHIKAMDVMFQQVATCVEQLKV